MLNKRLIYVTLFSLFWAFYIVFGKFVLKTDVNPLVYSLQAYLISTVVLLFFNLATFKDIKRLSLNQWKYLLSIGVLLGISVSLGNVGLKLSTSINYGFLVKSSVVFTTLLAVIFLKESWSKAKASLLLLFLIGAYLMTTQGKVLIPRLGDLLIITSAFFISSSAILQKPLLSQGIKPSLIAVFR